MKYPTTILLFLFFVNSIFSQNQFITTGIVTDIEGNIIKNAEIYSINEQDSPTNSVENGAFELTTKERHFLLVCKKKGYKIYKLFVTAPIYNLSITLQPATAPSFELTLIIKDYKKNRIDNTQLYFDNINGYDNFSNSYKHIISIPISEIEKRNNKLTLSLEKDKYKLDTTLIFNETEKKSKIKTETIYLGELNTNIKEAKPTQTVSKLALIVPGLYQYKKEKKGWGYTFMIGEFTSIIGIVAFQGTYNNNYNLAQSNKGNTELYKQYIDDANRMKRYRDISIISASLIYIVSTIDGFSSKYKANDKIAFYPSISTNHFGLSCSIKLR